MCNGYLQDSQIYSLFIKLFSYAIESFPSSLGKTEKPGGPPVQRLFSAPGSSTPKTPSDLNYVAGSTPQASFGLAPTEDHSEHYEESDAGTWVTIFGFPPSAASYILTQAGMWGHILEHKIPSQVRLFLLLIYQQFHSFSNPSIPSNPIFNLEAGLYF